MKYVPLSSRGDNSHNLSSQFPEAKEVSGSPVTPVNGE